MFSKKSFIIYLTAALVLLAIDIALFRTMGGLGRPVIHDFHWVIRTLLGLEQLVVLLLHPFDLISYNFIKEKPFTTPYTYEVVRLVFLPFSYFFYSFIWKAFQALKNRIK